MNTRAGASGRSFVRPRGLRTFTASDAPAYSSYQLCALAQGTFVIAPTFGCGLSHKVRRFTVYTNCPLPTPEDRLLFVLVYLKTHPLQVAHGILFGLPQGKTNQWLHLLLSLLRQALREMGDAPARTLDDLAKRLSVSEEALADATAPPFCHDGTERRITRPAKSDAQKSCYSGKKKCHTVKNVLLINTVLTILFLSDTHQGSVHDKRIADQTHYPLPADSTLLQDSGFQAYTLDDVECITPHKKPRGGSLSDEQKAFNRALSHRRVRIEHVNSSVKRCRIVKDTVRIFKHGIRDTVLEICCGLHNLRVRLTPWLPMV